MLVFSPRGSNGQLHGTVEHVKLVEPESRPGNVIYLSTIAQIHLIGRSVGTAMPGIGANQFLAPAEGNFSNIYGRYATSSLVLEIEGEAMSY